MSINKVILLGNLGKEPEVKTFDGGSKIAQFTLATTKKGFTTKSGNVIPDKTEWHNVVVLSGLADVCEKYLHKGSKVYIEGELRYREYEKDGAKRYVTEIFCEKLEMCDKQQNSDSNAVSQQKGINPKPEEKKLTNSPEIDYEKVQSLVDNITDDDLPF